MSSNEITIIHKKNTWHYKLLISIIGLFLLLAVSIVVCSSVGSSNVGFLSTLKILTEWLSGTSTVEAMDKVIITEIRFPRIMLAFFIGAALAVAGAILQGLLRNPLAEPYTLGVASGAAVGAAVTLLMIPDNPWLGGIAMPVSGFLMALLTGLLVYKLALINGRLSVETLILAGVIINSFMAAILAFLLTIAGENMQNIIFWMMGALTLRGSSYFIYVLPFLIIGIILACFFGKELNIFTFGEETAMQLGVSVEKVKLFILLLAVLLTGIAVSLAGTIGFVGLIIPHLVRLAIGADYRILLPISAVGGGIFLIWADTLARIILAPIELPVGVVTAFLGVPFFVYLLQRRNKSLF